MCHILCVTCPRFFGQSDEADRWRVFYQWGLPRLVYFALKEIQFFWILKNFSNFRWFTDDNKGQTKNFNNMPKMASPFQTPKEIKVRYETCSGVNVWKKVEV